jgi:hydrogenase/urease accessory protein HupE
MARLDLPGGSAFVEGNRGWRRTCAIGARHCSRCYSSDCRRFPRWRIGIIRFVALVLSLIALTQPALAHSPIKGIGTFYNGVLHPVLVPVHVLLIVGLGLLLGQHAPRLSRFGWFAFIAAFWIGLALGQASSRMPETALLILALIAGLLVVLEWSFGVVGMVALAIAAGLCIGLDSLSDAAQTGERWLAMAGMAVGGLLVVSYVGGVAAALVQPWQRIGIRVAGSWTVASAALVLALALAAPRVSS